jgi:hypothetical protein
MFSDITLLQAEHPQEGSILKGDAERRTMIYEGPRHLSLAVFIHEGASNSKPSQRPVVSRQSSSIGVFRIACPLIGGFGIV